MGNPVTGRDGKWSDPATFRLGKLQEAAAAAKFNVDQDKVTLPTLMLDDEIDPTNILEGVITRIHFRIKPTNAVTYTLRLWRAAVDGSTKPYEENKAMLYESAAGLVSDTDYDITELSIPFKLAEAGKLYYSLDWSAATGNVQGFIEVSGETVK